MGAYSATGASRRFAGSSRLRSAVTPPDGTRRHIEVKGRAGLGAVEMTANEYGRACNLGDAYWLYAVFQCETGQPQLHRVQNPFAVLIARNKGSVVIDAAQILAASQIK